MSESIEIIDLHDIQSFPYDVDSSELSICIISCLDFINDRSPDKSKIENVQLDKVIPKSPLRLDYSLTPHIINVTTGYGSGLLKYDYYDNVELPEQLLRRPPDRPILSLADKTPIFLPSSSDLGLFVKKSNQSVCTQTDHECLENLYAYKSDATTYPNIFFCTFHKNGDVETFCNISCASRTKRQSSEENGWPVDLEAKVQVRNERLGLNKTRSGSTFSLEKDDLQFIKDYLNEDEFLVHKIGSKNVMLENLAASGKNIDEGNFNLVSKKGKYLLRNIKEKKNKIWTDLLEGHCPKFKSLKVNILICEQCNLSFSTFSKLERHSKLIHNTTKATIKCKQCHLTFTKSHNLVRHIYNKHSDGLKKVFCDICGREFSRQDVLLTHKRLIHTDKQCKEKIESKQYLDEKWCNGCKKTFCRDKNLKIHQSGNLKCSKCMILFVCKTALKSHMDKDHLVTCSICGNVYSNERQLNIHKLKHSAKHECKFCNKGFSFEYQLTIHLATHTGNKPLMCEICGRSFAHKNSLNKHKWQEHTAANKKFKCAICGRGFVYMAKLESHMKSHSGNKPFVCHICPSYFSQKCSLAAHIKGIHGVYLHNEKKHSSKCKLQIQTLTNKKIVSVSSNDDFDKCS